MKSVLAFVIFGSLCVPSLAQERTAVPQFQVDPSWPKALPNRWILGQVSGIATDRYDRIWVVHRPGSLSPRERAWIAELDGQRAGAVYCVRKTDDVAQLRLLFVQSWARGHGLGARRSGEGPLGSRLPERSPLPPPSRALPPGLGRAPDPGPASVLSRSLRGSLPSRASQGLR